MKRFVCALLSVLLLAAPMAQLAPLAYAEEPGAAVTEQLPAEEPGTDPEVLPDGDQATVDEAAPAETEEEDVTAPAGTDEADGTDPADDTPDADAPDMGELPEEPAGDDADADARDPDAQPEPAGDDAEADPDDEQVQTVPATPETPESATPETAEPETETPETATPEFEEYKVRTMEAGAPVRLISAPRSVEKDWLSSSGFRYVEPNVLIGNSGTDKPTGHNLMWVNVKSSNDVPEADGVTYAYQKPSGGELKEAQNVQYSARNFATKRISAAYWNIPIADLERGEYTIHAAKAGPEEEYSEIKITLVEFKLHSEAGKFKEGEVANLVDNHNGTYSAFACPGELTLKLPQLNDDEAKGDFLGWSLTPEGGASQKLYTAVPAEQDSSNPINLYPAYGKKLTKSFVVTNSENNAEQVLEYTAKASVEIGADEQTRKEAAASVYVRNTGNVDITDVKVSSNSSSAFTVNTEGSKNTDGETIKAPVGDAPAYMQFNFVPKADKVGTFKENFYVFIGRVHISITVEATVTKKSVTITVQENIEKNYGEILKPEDLDAVSITATPEIPGKTKLSDFGVTLTSVGCSGGATANADESGKKLDNKDYPYGFDLLSNSSDYDVDLKANGMGVVVKQVKPQPKAEVTASGVIVGSTLEDSIISGQFHHHIEGRPEEEKPVHGTLKWKEPKTVLNNVETKGYDWIFTPDDNENYTTVEGTAEVEVSDKLPTVVRLANGDIPAFTYNGSPVDLSGAFEAVRDVVVTEGIELSWRPYGSDENVPFTPGTPTEAGAYTVKAEIKANKEYAAGSTTAAVYINRQKLYLNSYIAKDRVYSGKADDHAEAVVHGSGQTVTSFKIEINGSDECGNTARFVDGGGAGTGKQVEITLNKLPESVLPEGKAQNYELPVTPYIIRINADIYPKEITLDPIEEYLTKQYGERFEFSLGAQFTANGLCGGDALTDIDMTAEFTSDGEAADANVGSYDITGSLTNPNYTLKDSTVGQLKVTPATLEARTPPTASEGRKGNPLSTVELSEGAVVNSNNPSMVVPGTWTWLDGETELPSAGEYTARWRFTVAADQQENYEPDFVDGDLTITLLEKKPIPIKATLEGAEGDSLTVQYDGKQHALIPDASPHGTIQDVKYEEGSAPKNAGGHTVTVTARPVDSYGDYAETTKKFTITITQATPTIPPDTFSARENTRLGDIMPGEFNGVEGETVKGTFAWKNPDTPITEEENQYGWIFTPENYPEGNYTVAEGMATVTMAEDTRTVKGPAVYNLPGDRGDYVTVDLEQNKDPNTGLQAGDVIVIYKDDGNGGYDPVSERYKVTEEDLTSNAVPSIKLDTDALTADGGTLYVHIEGKKSTEYTQLLAKGEPDFTLTPEALRLHPEDGSPLKSADVTVTPKNIDKDAVQDVTWSCDGSIATAYPTSGAELTTKVTAGSSPGTGTLTVTVTFKHPDPAKSGEPVVVTHEIPLTVTDAYLVIPLPANGGSAQPSVVEQLEDGEVRVTLYPASGYRVTGLTVTEAETLPQQAARAISAGAPVSVERISDNVFRFIMPDSDVYVEPQFEAIPAPAPQGGGSANADPAAGEYIVCEACGHHFWEPYLDGWRCTTCGHLRGTTGVPADAAAKAARAAQTAARGRVPQTADESRPVLWALVFLASAAGLGLTLRARKKRQ